MGLPPSDAGAVQVTVADPEPPVATTLVGAPGTAGPGVTELDGADAGPVPIAFVAVTVKVYAVPLVSPVTVVLVPLVTGGIVTAGEEITV